MLLGGMLVACNNKPTTDNNMEQELKLTQEWDKVFPLSEKVNHKKVTFETQYGLTLAADLYWPKDRPTSNPSHQGGRKEGKRKCKSPLTGRFRGVFASPRRLWSFRSHKGAVERTLCHEDGRARFRGSGLRPFLYG